jgi:hypothetical protein
MPENSANSPSIQTLLAWHSPACVRFNHSFEVIDAAGQVHESIDAKARTGDLDALWKLVRTDMARLEMDADSFRIEFQDGSIVRSINQLDVRQPDLA